MKKNLILINGKKYSGKNTLVSFFEDEGYVNHSLADVLKKQLHAFLTIVLRVAFDKVSLYENKEKGLGLFHEDNKEITNNEVIQWYEQMMKKQFGENYWINKLVDKINYELKYIKNNCIIPDCKFHYELEKLYEYFKEDFNIYTIKIIRKNTDIKQDLDISKEFDFVIENTSNLWGDLFEEYKRIIKIIS